MQLKSFPWKRAFKIVSSGKNEVLYPCVPLPERKEYFMFSDIVGRGEIVIATRVGSIHEARFSNIENLKGLGKDLAVSDKYATDSLLEKHGLTGYREVTGDSSIIPMLLKERFRAFVGYRSVLHSLSESAGISPTKKIHMQTIRTIPYGFCISRKSARSKNILDRLNSAIKKTKGLSKNE